MTIQQPTITTEQNKRLLALLAEARARGIKLPTNIKVPEVKNKDKWNVDENGYFIRNDGKKFEPRPELVEFIQSKARFILIRSGRGGGKTVSGAQKAFLKIKQGFTGAAMNPDFENFKTSTWEELKRWMPWDMVVPKQRYRKSASWEPTRPFTMVFVNGAKLFCKGLKDPEAARGPNINFLWYDEGRRDLTGLAWKNAIAAVRVGKEPQAWCTTTPANSQHWTSTFFSGEITAELKKILDEIGTTYKQELFAIFQTSIEKNKGNLDPMFYASIIASYPSGYLRAREVEGRVADEEGSLGDRSWFDDHILPELPDWINSQIRFWDLAATEKKMTVQGKKNDPDETMGTLLGTNQSKDEFCIEDQTGGTWAWKQIKEMIVHVARRDGPEVQICFEQEPASGGKNQVAELMEVIQKELPEWTVSALEAKKLGDRVLAANTWFGEAAEGKWWMVKGPWNEHFLGQLDYFPNPAIHDDTITSVSGARHKIAPIRRWRKTKFVAIGINDKPEPETA
jgi:phage terminase large subunit-like protein